MGQFRNRVINDPQLRLGHWSSWATGSMLKLLICRRRVCSWGLGLSLRIRELITEDLVDDEGLGETSGQRRSSNFGNDHAEEHLSCSPLLRLREHARSSLSSPLSKSRTQ